MEKIKAIILFFAVLFIFFSCADPSENLYSESDKPKEETGKSDNIVYNNIARVTEFKEVGNFEWKVPDNIIGNATVTIVGGGGGGGGSCSIWSAGGGGAGDRVVIELKFIIGETIQITVGSGGSGRGSETDGNDGSVSKIVTNNIPYIARAGHGGEGARFFEGNGNGGSGYPGGDSGHDGGGYGGNNGLGYGAGGSNEHPGSGAPVNSGGGGGGAGAYVTALSGGDGGSGYVRIEYTISSK